MQPSPGWKVQVQVQVQEQVQVHHLIITGPGEPRRCTYTIGSRAGRLDVLAVGGDDKNKQGSIAVDPNDRHIN